MRDNVRKRREGYLFISQEATTDNNASLFESAIMNCHHCSTMVLKRPGRDLEAHPRGWCHKCDSYICDACKVGLDLWGYCVTRDQRIELALKYQGTPFAESGFLDPCGPKGELPFPVELLERERVH